MKVGVHVSIAGKIYESVDRAKRLGCDTFQIFSRSPRSWQTKELKKAEAEEFKKRRKDVKIAPVIVHIPYLINLASPLNPLYQRSISAYIEDIKRAEILGANYFVTHIGNHKGKGEEYGISRIISALNQIISQTKPHLKILLENTAGAGTVLGYNFAQIAAIIKGIKGTKYFGLCLDTAHAYAAGYNIATEKGLEETLEEIDELIGLNKLFLIHANDSKTALGSRVDRHEDIGKGEIGRKGFVFIVNHPTLRPLPFILETPKKRPNEDVENLKIIRALEK
ncbi:putative endonuclease 4 [subsurface metagenome]